MAILCSPTSSERPAIDWAGYVFVAFFTLPFLLFNVMPILFGVYVSFTEWSIIGEPRLVGLALFVNQGWPLSGLARTILFTPNVVSATVIGLVWVWLLDTQYGLLNGYLAMLGISPVPWLTSTPGCGAALASAFDSLPSLFASR